MVRFWGRNCSGCSGGFFKHGGSEGEDDYGVFGFLIDFLFLVDAELAGAHVYEEKKTSARGGLV